MLRKLDKDHRRNYQRMLSGERKDAGYFRGYRKENF